MFTSLVGGLRARLSGVSRAEGSHLTGAVAAGDLDGDVMDTSTECSADDETDRAMGNNELSQQFPHRMHRRGEAGSREDGQRKKSMSRLAGASGLSTRLNLSAGDRDDASVAKKVTRQRNEFSTCVKEWGPGVSQKAARTAAKSWDGFSWSPDSSKSGEVTYRCYNHVDCPCKIRVKYSGDCQGPELWTNGMPHSSNETTASLRDRGGRGVGGEWFEEIRTLKNSGLGAKGIRIELEQKYGGQRPVTTDMAKFRRIPTESAIQSHIQHNLRPASELLSNADMLALVAPMAVNSWEDLTGRLSHEPLVLNKFCRTVEIPVVDEEGDNTGEMTMETTVGFVTASRTQLEWLREVLVDIKESPRTFTVAISTDGTYRLSKGNTKAGAVLVDLDLHDITYNASNDLDTHNFLPILYMYCQVECFESYEVLFQTLKTLLATLLNLPDVEINPVFGGLDRASYIAKAYHAVWPEAEEN